MSQNLERSLRIFEVVALLSLPENTLVADPQGDLGQVEVLEERDDVFAGDPPGEGLELRNGDLALLPEEGDEFLLQRTDRAGVEVQVLHPQDLAPLGERLQRLLELPWVNGAAISTGGNPSRSGKPSWCADKERIPSSPVSSNAMPCQYRPPPVSPRTFPDETRRPISAPAAARPTPAMTAASFVPSPFRPASSRAARTRTAASGDCNEGNACGTGFPAPLRRGGGGGEGGPPPPVEGGETFSGVEV